MSLSLMWDNITIPPFIRCLESLQNLHTLEIGRADGTVTTPLKNALKRVKLPQIKTLIIPPEAYPLLQCCCDVEEVVWVTGDNIVSSDEFLGALAANRDSKVRRLAIPLVSWGNPSRKWTTIPCDHKAPMMIASALGHVVALPRLAELTLIHPHPRDIPVTETGVLLDTIGTVHSAMLELVNACRVLPDFDTLQIVHLLRSEPIVTVMCMYACAGLALMDKRERALRDQVKDLTIDLLKKAKVGRQEGEGRKNVVVRVIELTPCIPFLVYHLGSVKAEVFEV